MLPVMSLADGPNVSLDKRKAVEDPVSKAIMKGRTPTLKDVKMSVKVPKDLLTIERIPMFF